MRTTHMTGIVTDIGLLLGRVARRGPHALVDDVVRDKQQRHRERHPRREVEDEPELRDHREGLGREAHEAASGGCSGGWVQRM